MKSYSNRLNSHKPLANDRLVSFSWISLEAGTQQRPQQRFTPLKSTNYTNYFGVSGTQHMAPKQLQRLLIYHCTYVHAIIVACLALLASPLSEGGGDHTSKRIAARQRTQIVQRQSTRECRQQHTQTNTRVLHICVWPNRVHNAKQSSAGARTNYETARPHLCTKCAFALDDLYTFCRCCL